MADLRDPRWMYLKAGLLVAIGLVASALIVLETMSWRVAGLLALAVWAFARAYYFAFYVIERYVDPSYKFAGLWPFVMYLCSLDRSARGPTPSNPDRGEPNG